MKIIPLVRLALRQDVKAIKLYKHDDQFARAVLLAMFGIGLNIAAERIAIKDGMRGFKLNWNYDSFFALKCAVWACKNVTDLAIRKSVFKSNGVAINNIDIFSELERLHLLTAIRRAKLLMAPDVNKAAELCAKLVKGLQKSFLIKARYKLKFLVTFGGSGSYESFAGDMTEKAIYAFYRAYPLKSEQHLINSMRIAGYRYALNIIEFSQRDKRREIEGIDKGNKGYVFTSIPLADFSNQNAGFKLGERLKDKGVQVAAKDEIEQRDFTIYLKKCSKKKRKAIHLLSQEHDDAFLKYIKSVMPQLDKVHKIDTIYSRIGKTKYNYLIRRFVGMNKKRFRSFMDELKEVATENISLQ